MNRSDTQTMTIKPIAGLAVVILAIIIPIFGHLDSLPLFEWDESRLATSAFELLSGRTNPLIPTVDYEPDMWSTKPPLMIWMQALSMKLFGINELAVRLPSAIAGGLTCLFIYWIAASKLGNPKFGVLASLVLITSEAFTRSHSVRTGDYDALLSLFTTLHGGLFFLFIRKRGNKYIYLSMLSMALGVWTKGVAALLFTPALLVFVFVDKQHYWIFRSGHFYTATVSGLLIAVGYYLIREQFNPGYIRTIWINELGGRYGAVVEDHSGPWHYYLRFMVQERFTYWFFVVPLGIYAGLRSPDKEFRLLTLYAGILVVFFIAILSGAASKIFWYDLPAYPWLAIIVAQAIYAIFNKLPQSPYLKGSLNRGFLLLALTTLVFFRPYKDAFMNGINPVDDSHTDKANMAYLLKDGREGKIDIRGFKLLWDDHAQNLDWYYRTMKADYKLKQFSVAESGWNIYPGDKVAVYSSDIREWIARGRKDMQLLYEHHGAAVYQAGARPLDN
jgi:4-amino-4-deoxy-L-arabinose transferase-like glycosyltransferase